MTIERDKIRHRRPDDMRVYRDDDEPDAQDPALSQEWDDGHYQDDADPSWSDDDDAWPGQAEASPGDVQDWDEGGDDDWVIDDPSTVEQQAGSALEDSGVTWEDDDIQIGTSNAHQGPDDEVSFGPEVELAGKRDVRPRPPRRSRPQEAPRQRPAEHRQPRPEPVVDQGGVEDDFELEGAPPPLARQAGPSQVRGRFARTQATLEIDSDDQSSPPRMPPPSKGKRPPPSRRRQTQPPPALPASGGKQKRQKRKLLVMIAVLAVIGAGGWFAYQSLDGQGPEGLIEEWRDNLGGRTASDTAFESTTTPGDESETSQPDDDTTRFLPTATDTDTQREGPPIPEFKPREDASDVAASAGSGVQVEELETAVPDESPDEEAEGPSLMQQIWGNLISN